MTTRRSARPGVLVAGLCFVALHLFGLVWPESWWGTHFVAFLPPVFRYALPIAAVGMVVATTVPGPLLRALRAIAPTSTRRGPWLALCVAGAMGGLFYSFPISAEVYGDAPRFQTAVEREGPGDPTKQIENMLSLELLHPKIGERTVLNAAQLAAGDRGWEGFREFFRMLDAVCGGLFVLLWLLFVRVTVADRRLAVLLGIVGLTAPFAQMFYGHVEIYAPSMVLIAAVAMALCRYFATRRVQWLWALIPLQLLAMKFHASAVLLAPAVLLAFLHRFAGLQLHWKRVALTVLLPLFVVGACVYFFALGDHRDPRFLDGTVATVDRLFLPLFAPEAPLDRYTLLGGHHLFDFIQAVLLWSPGAWLLLTISRREADWRSPGAVVCGATLVLYGALFFMVNPLLGMQMDWDLFCLPAPLLLVLTAVVVGPVAFPDFAATVTGPVMALCLLSATGAAVNHDRDALSARLQALGIGAFQSSWIRSAGTIALGLDLVKDDRDQYRERYTYVVERLRPHANLGRDVEFADTLWRLGKYYRTQKDYETALRYHRDAFRYGPRYPANLVGLVEASFLTGRFPEAHLHSLALVDLGYPTRLKALRIAIHTGLEAGEREAVAGHAERYLQIHPKDRQIRGVAHHLRAGTNISRIRAFFSKPRRPRQR